ncbi:MAG TPA: GDYXXLXY domain-containing protein [Armatimonadota bacterium]|jgi:uncharacterized membrane-anchored protein
MNAGKWFAAIVLLQMAFLVGEAAMRQRGLDTGRPLVLRVHPVDPRSLFSGQYMALGFDAEDIDAAHLPVSASLKAGSTAYVSFRPDTPYARVASVESSPSRFSGVVPLRATVRWRDGKRLRVDFGMDRYYIPEARQAEVNRLWWNGRQRDVSALVKVDSKGRGVIEHILVDGKPLPY